MLGNLGGDSDLAEAGEDESAELGVGVDAERMAGHVLAALLFEAGGRRRYGVLRAARQQRLNTLFEGIFKSAHDVAEDADCLRELHGTWSRSDFEWDEENEHTSARKGSGTGIGDLLQLLQTLRERFETIQQVEPVRQVVDVCREGARTR